MASPRSSADPIETLRQFALDYPGTHEDHPWGETVVKVGKKVFVFLGKPKDGAGVGLSVKLPQSGAMALSLPFASPTGYGLGKSGWVSAQFGKGDKVPLDMLRQWIDESYRAVAPKTLVAQLAEGPPPAKGAPGKASKKAAPGKRTTKKRG
jgi:predicted DNA-binding protein (MmcQ/YjbR family)